MAFLNVFSLTSLFFLLCCTSADSSNKSTNQSTASKVNSSEKSCLEEYRNSCCDLISKENFAKIVDVEQSTITSENKEFKILKTFSCYYKWDSGRKVVNKSAIGDIESDAMNVVEIGNIKVFEDYGGNPSYKDQFDSTFDDKTTEEKAKIESDMLERVQSDDEFVTQLAKQAAKAIGEISLTPLGNLGDGAYMKKNKFGKVELYVLHKNLFFNVNTDISNDIEENLAAAIKLSLAVLERCQ